MLVKSVSTFTYFVVTSLEKIFYYYYFSDSFIKGQIWHAFGYLVCLFSLKDKCLSTCILYLSRYLSFMSHKWCARTKELMKFCPSGLFRDLWCALDVFNVDLCV